MSAAAAMGCVCWGGVRVGGRMMFDASVNKVFSCRKCGCETCVHCEKDWTDHFGLKCTEVEDSSA